MADHHTTNQPDDETTVDGFHALAHARTMLELDAQAAEEGGPDSQAGLRCRYR